MPPIERDVPSDGARSLRHQHSSSSDQGRALIIPMWDSSDPERAPPPLPLNPQSPGVGSSRPGTSSAIQSAHAALTEKARENALTPNPLLAKRMSEISPERPLPRPSSHRRMQSLQPGSVRDRSFLLECASSSPKSPEKHTRPSTPVRSRDSLCHSPEKEVPTSAPSPAPGSTFTPIVRPAVRRPQQSILGENTPPQSATMLALQNMTTPPPKETEAAPLSTVTNGSTALVRVPQPNTDPSSLSAQIVTLTNIATSLQKEMTALTRRSRDNATDLSSLKQATKARDEDIRKSLRELIINVHDGNHSIAGRDPFSSGLLIDDKPHKRSPSTSRAVRPFSLPRIPSPTSFAASIEREGPGSSTSSRVTAAPATIALLEKIVRDMGTREGQDLLVTRLSEVAEGLAGMAPAAKVDELLDLVRNSEQRLVAMSSGAGGGDGGGECGGRNRNFSFDDGPHHPELPFGGADTGSGPMTRRVERLLHDSSEGRRASAPARGPTDVVSEDILNIIRSVKDSVAQGGGLTAEVKALVRELRGEVLGMGREIRRRLDEISAKSDEGDDTVGRDDMERVINQGLAELKEHMDHLLREHRRQSTSSAASKASLVDYQEIYNAMRAALKDSPGARQQPHSLNRDDIIAAVSGAWENYKPEINVEQFGLERDEILACLKEGFQMYTPRDDRPAGATRDEVFKAVVEGLKHFAPPQIDSAASLTRDEVLDAVRECLEEFEFPLAPSALGHDMTRDDVVQAVKEGLDNFEFPAPAPGSLTVAQPDNGFITSKLHEIVDFMKLEFQAVSDEAKENVAANGRDTEQVLDATKDGFEKLRADMEDYVDRMKRLSGQDEAIERLMKVLDDFRSDVADMLQGRIDSIRDTVNMCIVPAAPQNSNKEALDTLKDGLDSIRAELQRPLAGTGEIMDAIHDGLAELRTSVEKMNNRPVDLTANDEILEALKLGLDGLRSDIDGIREARDERAVAPISDNAVVPADMLKHDDIKNLEVLITQLRIKVEAMESQPEPDLGNATKDDVARLEEVLRNVKDAVDGMPGSRHADAASPDPSLRDDVQAIETILRNAKARLDDLIDGEQAVRKEHIDTVETLIMETRESLAAMASQVEFLSRKEDISMLESLIGQVAAGYDEMKERADKEAENPERVVKSDVEAVEAACLDLKMMLEQVAKTDLTTLPTKGELEAFAEDLKSRIETGAEASTKAMEERQAETVGVSDRITEVKEFLDEFHDMTKTKLEDGVGGIETLGKLLEKMGDTISGNATVSDDLREMFGMMKTEFEESRAGVVGAKLEADEKFQQTTETLGSKIDARIDELMAKYDEFQSTMDDRAKAGEARDLETEAAFLGTKAVADELKLLVDTLGSTVTESLEKMEEASKTVFNRVEDLVSRTDETNQVAKSEHQETRDRVQDAIAAVEALQIPVSDFQPKIFETVKDILLIVGQHYDFSKTSTTDIADKIEEAKPPPPPEPPMLPPVEKYDDTNVHEKLDKLVDHSHAAGKAFAQLDTLDRVHDQVLKTACDISSFLDSQKQRIEAEYEDREKTLQDTAIELERKVVQKEQVEESIAALREEEARLRETVLGLKTDQEHMTRQKTRLTADLSSLETALRLRRHELQDMETRAEGLERRIVEGVMDHSRVLLMAKASKGPDSMSRKRVKIQRPSEEAMSTDQQLSKPAAKMALAMKRAPNPAGAARRIVSLGQINSNVASGGFKRSHSVKTPSGIGRGGMRKSSWGGSLAKRYGELDKENASLKESDEENEYRDSSHGLVPASGAGSPRRSSIGTNLVSTTTGNDYSDAESFDDGFLGEPMESAVGTTLSESTVVGNEIVLLEH